MKFTLSWLKRHLETEASVDEIVETLTDLGLEVEDVEDRAARLADFTIGKVLEAEKHPDADRLKVCKVETDDGVTQIICGAPNARAGITVVVAKPGTYVPGIDTTIQVGKIRGIESHGMMASEREMELSDEHDGIIELQSGEVGQRFVDWLAQNDPAKVDPVIEIAITPNRGDALGVRGIARDLAARGLGRLRPLDTPKIEGRFDSPVAVTIDDDTRDGCPVFCLRMIRGVKNGPSPDWLQAQLRAIGLRPISFLVDVTNWFTHDLNRPLHVFDADVVAGHLRVHRAAGGETITALDEKAYSLPGGAIAISDANGVESIAGIMGGAHSGVTEQTVNVLVESAYWDPVQIATTGRALKINSDARYRFERGVDPAFTPNGLDHAVRMILDHAGGEPSHMVVAGAVPETARSYELNTDRVESLVGMSIPADEQRATLTALGFEVSGEAPSLSAAVPSWRGDVQGEADLVEEVARIASLTKLQGKPMTRPAQVLRPVLTPMQMRERTARRTLAALGYDECVTYSFIDAASAALFADEIEPLRLENPISSEMSHMRPALLPGLLQAAARNQARGVEQIALFEVGAAFHGGEPGEQHLLATGLLVGPGPRDLHGTRRAPDVFDAKADAEAVLAALGAPAGAQVMRGAADCWHPGRSGRIGLGPKKTLAVFGEVHPRILRALDVRGPAVGFTIWPAEIPFPKAAGTNRGALQMSDLQAVERDFAFVLDAGVEAQKVVMAARGADKTLIDDVRVFDEFVGGNLGEGRKSIAISVRLQPREATLTDKEIEAVAAKVVEKVTKATGGELRG
ncbi:phenylalanine--tRNA ligase subunit beta [Jannaschia aquimarina]|uniref:Phenylalanine--tRNA ligase beta subunit n=1 Tax=Jannaschia aquimarina TaxID=935700 RepID=A0A0D1EEP7_9RHOB|nr:phenylalanine--tRNA ligase subunit beta [Jannaschia aquimarina]KIT15341.1 Phenylalanine--tRNA ligase beta subunit [Jannaschia aquimarina]SNS51625.1 phenylalanyl-tRNA synthetase beta subunit [Jannaschia aquimarina]